MWPGQVAEGGGLGWAASQRGDGSVGGSLRGVKGVRTPFFFFALAEPLWYSEEGRECVLHS